jgi:hypothetical protein
MLESVEMMKEQATTNTKTKYGVLLFGRLRVRKTTFLCL